MHLRAHSALRVIIGLGIIALLVSAGWVVLRQQPQIQARSTVIGLPSNTSPNDAFARVYKPRDFVFPLDHGPHPDYQTEWWYYTGNLADASGRHFGFQLTFFRRGLVPLVDMPARQSDLASSQVYFAHFAVTDSAMDRHVAFEKFSRGAAGLAGASGDPFKAFVEDWSVVAVDHLGEAVHLRAAAGAYGIDLNLKSLKPLVLEGDHGLSAQSAASGNASYYYSFTRLATNGAVKTESGSYDVTGLSWMDHEWSTSALGANAQGWDWFALQLSGQRELMFFQIRNRDGSIDPVSSGTLVNPDGSSTSIDLSAVKIDVLDRWHSADPSADYPVRWHIAIPRQKIDLVIAARVRNQQMNLSTVYWEGAVTITGQDGAQPIMGSGYVELTGYSESINGRF